ncbi:DUF1722 domain-containing protein, partial [Klebsiella quasipneumoniae]|nr:DUF1722 domain-containing protein [Klebsiella quasipneumoniae]
ADFAIAPLATVGALSGFIVGAKAPCCGMERVRLYDEKGNRGRMEGVGVFTGGVMARDPWRAVEVDGRRHVPLLLVIFVERV